MVNIYIYIIYIYIKQLTYKKSFTQRELKKSSLYHNFP